MIAHFITTTLLILSLGLSDALAADPVQFTNKELGAVFTLLRPELNSIELNGRKAIFDPSPSMKYLGMEHSETSLDLSVIADIVDLEFNHIKAKMPVLKFEDGSFKIGFPIEDQERGVRSWLGSISFKNVVFTAFFGWSTRPNGVQELVLVKTGFEGSLKGTGVLRSQFILTKARDFCLNLLARSMRKTLQGEKLQNEVFSGLIQYGKFYTGNEIREVAPSSIRFFDDGIQYEVQ